MNETQKSTVDHMFIWENFEYLQLEKPQSYKGQREVVNFSL